MRADKEINKQKVEKELFIKPIQTQRDIAEGTNLGLGTVNRAIKELEQTGTKDERILSITETDIKIVELGQNEIKRRLETKEELEKMKTIEISQVIKENTARYSLFKGQATDNEGGLKNIDSINIL